MRQKIIFIIVLLLVMATLPLAICKNFTKNLSKQTFSEKDKQSEIFNGNSQDFTKETLASLVAAQYRDEYNEETLKAIAVIIHTNYKTKPDSFNFDDNDIYISENDADSSLKENYYKIKTAVDGVYEKTLCQNDKAFYIPYSYLSNGTTKTDEEFPYIQNVASPWDCYSNEYDEDSDCIGISLYGLNYLCKKGYDYASALKWYLPDFEIK